MYYNHYDTSQLKHFWYFLLTCIVKKHFLLSLSPFIQLMIKIDIEHF